DTLKTLIDKGKEGLRWQQLEDAATDYVEPAIKTIKEEIETLDKKIATLSEKDRQDMLKTTNQVLKQVAIGQESGVNKAVEDEWEAALRRNKTLSQYNTKCLCKAAVGALTIASSLASMIATGGSVFLGVVAICKAASELAVLVSNMAQDVSEAADELDVWLVNMRDSVEKEQGKVGSTSRELMSDLSPIIGKCMVTVKTCDLNQVKLEAKIASLDKSCDDLVGSLNAALDKLKKLDSQEQAKAKRIQELSEANTDTLNEVLKLQKEVAPYRKFNEQARLEIMDWKAKRAPKTKSSIKAQSLGKWAVALGTAARTFGKIAGLPIP